MTFPRALLIFCVATYTAAMRAADYTSSAAGGWATASNWSPNANPHVGSDGSDPASVGTDNVTISGHAMTYDPTSAGVGTARTSMVLNNGNTLTITNLGSLQQTAGAGTFQVGRIVSSSSGAGTLNIQSGTFNAGNAAAVNVGVGAGATGNVVVGDGVGAVKTAVFNGNAKVLNVGPSTGSGGAGTITINSDGYVFNTRAVLGINGATANLTINGGTFETRSGVAETVDIASTGAANATVTLNGNALFWDRENNGVIMARSGSSSGTVIINGNSVFRVDTGNNVIVGDAGTGRIVINDNGSLLYMDPDADGEGSALHFGGRAGSGRGTLIVNGGLLDTTKPIYFGNAGSGIGTQNAGMVRTNTDFLLGHASNNAFAATSSGTYNLTGGTVDIGGNLYVGHTRTGIFTQDDGTVIVGQTLATGAGGTGARQGTYNLNGGVLRTNNIDLNAGVQGTFNWGAGKLTVKTTNSGSSGVFDHTVSTATQAFTGTTINVDGGTGGLTTSSGSVLDLGGIYLNAGTRFDNLLLSAGTLNLSSGGDGLLFNVNPYLLRASGFVSPTVGSLPLLIAPTITGTFNTFTGVGSDTIGFAQSGFDVSDPASLNENTWDLEYATGVSNPFGLVGTYDVLFFHYKVTAAVPEPASFAFLAVGCVLLRAGRTLRRVRGHMANQG